MDLKAYQNGTYINLNTKIEFGNENTFGNKSRVGSVNRFHMSEGSAYSLLNYNTDSDWAD